MADYTDPISRNREVGFYFVWNNLECRLLSRFPPATSLMDIAGFWSLMTYWFWQDQMRGWLFGVWGNLFQRGNWYNVGISVTFGMFSFVIYFKDLSVFQIVDMINMSCSPQAASGFFCIRYYVLTAKTFWWCYAVSRRHDEANVDERWANRMQTSFAWTSS